MIPPSSANQFSIVVAHWGTYQILSLTVRKTVAFYQFPVKPLYPLIGHTSIHYSHWKCNSYFSVSFRNLKTINQVSLVSFYLKFPTGDCRTSRPCECRLEQCFLLDLRQPRQACISNQKNRVRVRVEDMLLVINRPK